MGNAVLDKLVALDLEAPIEIPAHQVGLGIEHPRAVGGFQYVVDESRGESAGAGIAASHHAADPTRLVVVEHPHVGPHTDVVLDPDVAGARFGIAPVELLVDATLLHHKHLDPQAHDLVKLVGRKATETTIHDLHGVEPTSVYYSRVDTSTAANGHIQLCYESFGILDDLTIILLPGMGNQLLVYPEEFCESLVDRGFHVIRMDNRDAGLSTVTVESEEYTLDDMAADVIAVLDAEGVDDAVVLGLSLGGMIAQVVAIRYPQRVRALVSLASASGESAVENSSPEVIEALMLPPEPTLEQQVETDLKVRPLWSNPDWFDEDQMRTYFRSLYERSWVPGGGLRQLAAAARSTDRTDQLRRLDVPTLVVHGENDTLIPREAGRLTAQLVPGAEYLEIEGMSHDFVYQMWPALIEAVTALAARTFD